MKYPYFIILGFLIVACSTSQSEYYRKIAFAKYPKAIFQREDLTTGKIELDTIVEIKWDGKRLITKVINDFNEDKKMMLGRITTFHYENNETQESFLNYDLLGDSLRYIDTSYYLTIGEIKRYEIEGSDFDIIKRISNSDKRGKASRYDYVSKKYGWLAFQVNNENIILTGYEKRQLNKFEKLLIDTLVKDKTFFTLK